MSRVALQGRPCHWCRRPMNTGKKWLQPTKDHATPRAHLRRGLGSGRIFIVWACFACNQLKGDMSLEAWTAVMTQVPEWWRFAEMRGPRGVYLHAAMVEDGFEMPPLPDWQKRTA